MKRIIILGFLTFLAAGSVTQFLPLLHPSPAKLAVATSPPAISPTGQSRNSFYVNQQFKFRIVSPQGYIITRSQTKPSTPPATPLQVLEMWPQANFRDQAKLTEAPPIISIAVYRNSPKSPLASWKSELSRNDDRHLTVAGQNAIAYTSTGLYEYDNVLFRSPDDQYVFRLTVGYLNSKDQIRRTFQTVVSSFRFDAHPNVRNNT